MDLERVRQTARLGSRKVREIYAVEGARGVARRGRRYLRSRQFRAGPNVSLLPTEQLPVDPVWHPHVLSVAERSLPQCYHYRVEQKRELCELLGVPFDDVPLDDVDEVLARMQLASVLIVYRLPESAGVERIVAEAHRLRIPVVYEVDDLIYRRDVTAANPNLNTLPADLRAAVIAGSAGYAAAMSHATHNLASTRPLAQDMASLNDRPDFVIDNGIDRTMLDIVKGLRAQPVPPPGPAGLVVTYGSGSRAHDHDFELAAEALAQWLSQTPQGLLKILGPVRIPDVLRPFEDRIIRRTQTLAYGEYLRELAGSTISLAPLTDDHFNAFKSQVKYLESALVGVPLIASPMVYANYIEDGRTGIIARSSQDWLDALQRLSGDEQYRREISLAARDHVRQWELTQTPKRQLAELIEALVPGVRWEAVA